MVVLVNQVDLLLVVVVQWSLLLYVGVEVSVVVIKSFIVSLVVGVLLMVYWQDDVVLLDVLGQLLQVLWVVCECDWLVVVEVLVLVNWFMIVGCGIGFLLVLEVVFKCKEICVIQVEVFSGVEIKYGLMVLIEDGYLLLMFVICGFLQVGMLVLVVEMCVCGVRVLLVVFEDVIECDFILFVVVMLDFDFIVVIQVFYVMVV